MGSSIEEVHMASGFAAVMASGFAAAAHRNQKYDGGSYYENHLSKVVYVLVDHGTTDPEMIAAAWLHDVLEDTDVTAELLRSLFSPLVVNLVEAVTDQPGPTREARKALTYPKIRQAGKQATRIKLADRIANVEAAVAKGNDGLRFFQMYTAEHGAFKNGIFQKGENLDMWGHLEDLLVLP